MKKFVITVLAVGVVVGGGIALFRDGDAAIGTSLVPTQTPGIYTMDQVAQHASAASCYTVVNGIVYDVTTWIPQHPGGSERIMALCGKDGSAAFTKKHTGQERPETTLASFTIGTLAQ